MYKCIYLHILCVDLYQYIKICACVFYPSIPFFFPWLTQHAGSHFWFLNCLHYHLLLDAQGPAS